MALKPRPPNNPEEGGDDKYVSVVTGDQFSEFAVRQPLNGVNGDHEDLDEEFQGYEDSELDCERGGRSAANNNLASKISSAKEAILNFKMPTPAEIKTSYINSNFHKSFQQPLMVKAKVERPEVQRERQNITQEKNPAQLSQIHGLSDIPVPKLATGGKTPVPGSTDGLNGAGSKLSLHNFSMAGTLTRSLKEQQLITGVKETPADDETLNKRMELTKTMTPTELAAIHSLSDIPVPSRLKNIFDRPNLTKTFNDEVISNGGGQTDNDTSSFMEHGIYGTLPRSLRETKLITNVKVEESESVLLARKTLVDSKTPNELSAIHGISDLPIPSRIEKMMSMKRASKKASSTPGGLDTASIANSVKEPKKFAIPEVFTMELAVKTKVETDPEELDRRRKLVEEKKPLELSAITSISDLPVPSAVTKVVRSLQGSASTRAAARRNKEKRARNLTIGGIFNTDTSPLVPESMRETKLMVRAKVEEDPDVLAARQQLVKTSSPAELSAINSIDDLPVPTAIKNLTLRRNKSGSRAGSRLTLDNMSTRGPSRMDGCGNDIEGGSGKNMFYNSLPRSIRDQQLIVRSKTEEDPEELQRRQELTRTKSPTELSQISGISDLPIPTRIETMIRTKSPTEEVDSPLAPPRQKWRKEDIYDSIPSSLRSELIVRSRDITDQEELKQRQETIRSHTPVQLSEIHGLKDLPIPTFIETQLKRLEGTGSESGRAEPEPEAETEPKEKGPFSIYDTLPAAFKQSLVVKAVQEEPHVQQERAETVKSKSVNELSQIHSLSDLPVPSGLVNLAKRGYAPVERKKKFKEQMNQGRALSSHSLTQSLYSTLPRSLSEKQLLVRARVEEPEVLAARRELVSSKSVSELSQVTSLNDFPVPTTLSRIYRKSMERLDKIVQAVNPSAMKAFSTTDITNGDNTAAADLDSRPVSRGALSIKSDLYATLPRSLTDQVLVRTKVEADVEVLRARQALVETKTPAELGKIHNLEDVPIPTRVQAWLHQLDNLRSQEKLNAANGDDADGVAGRGASKKLTDMMYRTLPASLSQPCVVRSKVEDPVRLIERQQLQQTKSIHELSKIRNLNEFPVPLDLVKLPDVPLPKMRSLLDTLAKPPKRRGGGSSKASNNASCPETPNDGDYRMSPQDNSKLYSEISDEEECRQVPDAEYEVVMKPHVSGTNQVVSESLASNNNEVAPDEFDTFGLANQVKGTPERSTRGGKKKPSSMSGGRRSRDVDDGGEQPPPLPPKRLTPSPKKGMSLDSQGTPDDDNYPIKPVKGSLQLKLGIQSMPLPAPPAPPRTLKKKSESVEDEVQYADKDDITYNTCTENFRTAAETLNSRTLVEISSITQKVDDSTEDVTLADSVVDNMHSCADTLVGESESTLADLASGDEDNPYPSVYFESDKRGGANNNGSLKRTSRRLEEGTQQLSVELMEHVESLRSTLDNMSNKLGTRSRSRSESRSRSRPRQ